MNEGNYVLAWLFYLLAAAGSMIVFWRMTKFIPYRPVKTMLQLLFATFILVPWYIHPGSEHLAPAFVITALEIFIKKTEPGDAAVFLALMLFLVFVGALVVEIRDYIRGERATSTLSRLLDKILSKLTILTKLLHRSNGSTSTSQ